MNNVIVVQPGGPNMLVRLLYFFFVGWWLGLICSMLAWFLNITVIGLPLGLWIINRLPAIITLRAQKNQWRLEEGMLKKGKNQRSLVLRATYFILIGWWFSGLWMLASYGFILIIIGVPLAFWMLGRVGAVTTLYRS